MNGLLSRFLHFTISLFSCQAAFRHVPYITDNCQHQLSLCNGKHHLQGSYAPAKLLEIRTSWKIPGKLLEIRPSWKKSWNSEDPGKFLEFVLVLFFMTTATLFRAVSPQLKLIVCIFVLNSAARDVTKTPKFHHYIV